MVKWDYNGDMYSKEILITKNYSISIKIEEDAVKMAIRSNSAYSLVDHVVSITKPKPLSFIYKILRRKEPLSLEEQVFNTFNMLKQRIQYIEGSAEDPLVTELKNAVDIATNDASEDNI